LLALFSLMWLVAATGCAGSKSRHQTKTDRARDLIDIANGALMEGDPTSALIALLQAEKDDKNLPELHHSKALVFYVKQDQVTAFAEVKEALRIKPDYSDALNTLGKFLLDQSKYAEAIPSLERAAKDPIYRDAYKPLTNLGIIHYRLGHFAEAKTALNRAIMAAPLGACVAYFYRGHLELRESHFNEAIRDYDQSTKRFCTSFSDAHLALGIAYQYNHQYDDARKKFLEIEQRFPGSTVADQANTHLRALP
ncbi:MAG: tetratricopeptide repeat protein, partial [Bdellovibrionota bacterium]